MILSFWNSGTRSSMIQILMPSIQMIHVFFFRHSIDGRMCPKSLLAVIVVPWHSRAKLSLQCIFVLIRLAKTTNVIFADGLSLETAIWLGNFDDDFVHNSKILLRIWNVSIIIPIVFSHLWNESKNYFNLKKQT